MKKLICVILLVNLFIDCSDNRHSDVLPEKYKLEETEKISPSHIYEINFYNVGYASFDFEELKEIQISCDLNCSDCSSLNWISYSGLTNEKKELIYEIVEENVLADPQNQKLPQLMSLVEQKGSYVAACYQEHKTQPLFYKSLYFFNPSKRDFIVMNYIGENY